jgi:hypothetical protein
LTPEFGYSRRCYIFTQRDAIRIQKYLNQSHVIGVNTNIYRMARRPTATVEDV